MKFIDEAKIEVHAGKGGDGAATFRREKYIRYGGPNVGMGRDHTLYARVAGQVQYGTKGVDSKKTVTVVAEGAPA